jgi:hypothetical protein
MVQAATTESPASDTVVMTKTTKISVGRPVTCRAAPPRMPHTPRLSLPREVIVTLGGPAVLMDATAAATPGTMEIIVATSLHNFPSCRGLS